MIIIMSSAGEEVTSTDHGNAEYEGQCVIKRVADLPLVSSTYEMVSSTYASAKESHPAIQAVCEMAEMGVKTIAISAASTAQPLLDKFELQIAAANTYACRGLNKLQETLPVVHQRVEKVISDTKDLVNSAKDSVYNRVTETKDIVSSMVDVAIVAAQESMEMAKDSMMSSVNTVMEVKVGQMMISGVDKIIEKSEDLLDHYLPVTDEELAALATSVDREGFGVAPLEKQKEDQSYYVRLGSLSTKLCCRAYQHSLAKMQKIRQTAQDAFFRLEKIAYLLKYTKQMLDQKVHRGQEKLNQMWQEWYQCQMEQSQISEGSQTEMESQALSICHSVAQQVQDTCHKLLANMQGLPAHLQEKIQQAEHDMKELQATLSSARSFQEFPSDLLKESPGKIDKAQEAVHEIMDFVTKSPSLLWVVGPFSPGGSSARESPELEEVIKVDA